MLAGSAFSSSSVILPRLDLAVSGVPVHYSNESFFNAKSQLVVDELRLEPVLSAEGCLEYVLAADAQLGPALEASGELDEVLGADDVRLVPALGGSAD